MSDMQKVRVSLTDAEGNVHEVVGYQYLEEPGTVYQRDEPDGDEWSIFLLNEGAASRVNVIQELPTGLGAVVEVASHGEQFVHVGEGLWSNHESEMISEDIEQIPFTVLSEGIK